MSDDYRALYENAVGALDARNTEITSLRAALLQAVEVLEENARLLPYLARAKAELDGKLDADAVEAFSAIEPTRAAIAAARKVLP